MIITFIDAGDPRYDGELELRYRVLREPLGLARIDAGAPVEAESLHLVAVEEGAGAVVGCVLFRWLGEGSGRLFQMAVAPERQRRGLGRRLVAELEAEVGRRGAREIVLHARAAAVSFYERLGYAVDEAVAPLIEVTIPHRLMRKRL